MMSNGQPGFTLAVKAALVRGGRLLIVQRSMTDTSSPGMWEFCGGRVEFGEHPTDALVREVTEEAGLAAEIHDPLYVDSFLKTPQRQVVIITFAATAAPGEVRLSFEHQAYQWVTRSQALARLDKSIVRSLEQHRVLPKLALMD